MADPIADVSPPRQVFVIFDTVAKAFVGPLIVERHPAPACRMFHELLGDKSTSLAKHPQDYQLRFVGYVCDDGALVEAEVRTVTSGEAWLAAQSQEN